MAPIEEFESLLKEIVNAKRLSARKVNDITMIALKSMKEDTQLVSILYRTHRTLSPSAKISSLYVFDALARAARSQTTKHPTSNDPHSSEGNCATFLSKVEGVLEGLFTDMVSLGLSDAKEKTQKILDIWIKGNTFPSASLSRLKEIVIKTEQGQKEPEINQHFNVPPSNGVPHISPPPPVTGAANSIPDPQATLLALLAQAANAATSNGQIHPNTSPLIQPPPEQLALIQRLAQAAKAGNGSLGNPPGHGPPPPSAPMGLSAPHPEETSRSPSSYREPDHNFNRRPAKYDNYDESDRGHDYHRNNYAGPSRGFRGFRGRGRGHDPRGGGNRWDDRGDRMRDQDRSPSRRPRHSRSRSPPGRYGGRRDHRPYSPPRRPSNAMPHHDSRSPRSPRRNPNEPEKDEFGRDIRPPSPTPSDPASTSARATTPIKSPQPEISQVKPPAVESTTSVEPNEQAASSNMATTEPSSEPAAVIESAAQPPSQMQFDYTNPASWEALGKQWSMTYGYTPSPEEMMQYVMMGGVVNANSAGGNGTAGWSNSGYENESTEMYNRNSRGGRGRGGYSRGRGGGYGRGNPRDTQGMDTMATDAIVLGGDTDTTPMAEQPPVQHHPQQASGNSGGAGGRMQRVGDKWVFVRS